MFDIFETKIENEHAYMVEYETFMNAFKLTEVSAEEVGVLIMRLTGYLARYNVQLTECRKKLSRVSAELANSTDPLSGKNITNAKAEALAADTPQAAAYDEYKCHLTNLEQYVNSLKSLQRSLSMEYGHAS
jgi:hypothetical protein